eukprot:SAG11_NODE_4256_length_1984_cov_1.211141_3_plen_51_part_00
MPAALSLLLVPKGSVIQAAAEEAMRRKRAQTYEFAAASERRAPPHSAVGE